MTLRYVPLPELERLRSLEAGPDERIAAFADACRINTLYAIARAGSGHIGTSFSAMDIVSWLHLEEMEDGDRYFSSKGHDAPGLYAVLISLGRLDFELIHRLRRLGGLPGHPDVLATPEVVTNTGSLGMGISKAKGFTYATRFAGRQGRVFVLTGDGELQEGQFWESLGAAANRRLGEIVAIVDHNKIQSDTWVAEVSDLGDLEGKVRSFGWAVARCDGHSPAALRDSLRSLERDAPELPKLIVADTLKGAGVSFMEPHELPRAADALYGFHSGAPSEEEYGSGVAELLERLNRRLAGIGVDAIELADADEPRSTASPSTQPPDAGSAREPERLVAAYGEALAAEGEAEPKLVALDADLVLDTGLIPFRDRFPERFVECGIAEQDMVSQAGAMALDGLVPAVHSFACFLTPRANEQIYNNATEGTKVIYAGSLVGLVPAGPGHSHQSVRDISALGAMPGMDLIEPYCESEAAAAVRWAVREADGSVYIRLVSVPWQLPFEPSEVERLEHGRGTLLREGSDGLIVTTGPVMVAQAWEAASRLSERGLEIGLVALPWLRRIDGAWLAELAGDGPLITIDNHYVSGGQGEAVLAALSEVADPMPPVVRLGIESVPVCGTNDEALRAHSLDTESVAERIGAMLPARA